MHIFFSEISLLPHTEHKESSISDTLNFNSLQDLHTGSFIDSLPHTQQKLPDDRKHPDFLKKLRSNVMLLLKILQLNGIHLEQKSIRL